MKVFVTGSTGLLGNNVVRALREGGHEVTGLVRSPDKARKLLGDLDGVHFVRGDMRDVASFADALEGHDAVVHTAAYFREYYAPGDHEDALRLVNIEGTLALMRAADEHRVGVFIHTSSSGAVGTTRDGSPADEDTPLADAQIDNRYFASKVQGEQKIAAFRSDHGMKVVQILPGWMFGPGDVGPTNAGRMVLDIFAEKFPAVPPGGASIVDARDVADAIVRATERAEDGERFLVAGRFVTLRQCVDAIADASGAAKPKWTMPAALALLLAYGSELWARLTKGAPAIPIAGIRVMLARHRYSSQKAITRLGVDFRPFSDTARDVVDFYRAQGAQFGFEIPAKVAHRPAVA